MQDPKTLQDCSEEQKAKIVQIAKWQEWSLEDAWRFVRREASKNGTSTEKYIAMALDLVANHGISRPHKKIT